MTAPGRTATRGRSGGGPSVVCAAYVQLGIIATKCWRGSVSSRLATAPETGQPAPTPDRPWKECTPAEFQSNVRPGAWHPNIWARPPLHVWRRAHEPCMTLTWRKVVDGDATNMNRLLGPSPALLDGLFRRTAQVRALAFFPSLRCCSCTLERPNLTQLFSASGSTALTSSSRVIYLASSVTFTTTIVGNRPK